MADLPKILFVCIGNTCRSQRAEGFAKFYGWGKVEVKSAGTSAMGIVNRTAVGMMKEKGIDMSGLPGLDRARIEREDLDIIFQVIYYSLAIFTHRT